MGASSDISHARKVEHELKGLGIPTEVRITSAHKSPDQTLKIVAEYESKAKGRIRFRYSRISKWLNVTTFQVTGFQQYLWLLRAVVMG